MRQFAKISPKVFGSPKFKKLESDKARLAYFWLHLSPNANSLGCFMVSPGDRRPKMQRG